MHLAERIYLVTASKLQPCNQNLPAAWSSLPYSQTFTVVVEQDWNTDGSWLGKTGLRQWDKAVWHMSSIQIWNIYWGLHSVFQWRVYIKFVLVELLMKGMTAGTANPHLVINVDWIQPHVSSDMGLAAMKQTLSHQNASSPVCVDVRQKASDCLIRGV